MKNVLFFFSTTKIGGTETNIINISRELTQKGNKIFWAFLDDSGPMLDSLDFEVQVLKCNFTFGKYFRFIRLYSCFLQAHRIDTVLNFGLRVELLSRILSKRAGAKKIISNIRSTDDWRKFYHTFLDRGTSGSVDLWVSNSMAGKSIFHKRERIPLDKIKIIYNFITPSGAVQQTPEGLNVPLRIGILANVTELKGYIDLLKISQYLTSKRVYHIVKYAGRDMMKGKFEKLIHDSELEPCFQKLGYVKDKTAFFNTIDIFILPSYLEGMPTAILEAMSFGKPVVATKCGGIPELIEHGINGFLVLPGDISGMGEHIISLCDRFLYEKIVKNGYEKITQFDKDLIISQWQLVI